jgi:hypothetical protein
MVAAKALSQKDQHRLSPVTATSAAGEAAAAGNMSGRLSPALSVGSGGRSKSSRPASPAHRADVPTSVDSETDADGGETSATGDSEDDRASGPPALPPKERPRFNRALSVDTSRKDGDTDAGGASSPEDLTGDSVKRMSHATFIAPALPPIRFSMSADLTDLLKSVGGVPSRTSLDQLAKLAEQTDKARGEETPRTPSTVESPQVVTPTQFTVGSGDQTPVVKGLYGTRTRSASATSAIPTDSIGSTVPYGRPRGGSATTTDTAKPLNGVKDKSPLVNGTDPLAAQITLTVPDSNVARPLKQDKSEVVTRRIHEVLADATNRGVLHVKLDLQFVQAIVDVLEQRGKDVSTMKSKFDSAKVRFGRYTRVKSRSDEAIDYSARANNT